MLCTTNGSGETINKLNDFLEQKFLTDIELHVKEFEKSVTWIKTENQVYNLAGVDQFKSELFAKVGRVKHKELDYLLSRLELTYEEIVEVKKIMLDQLMDKHYHPVYIKPLISNWW